MRVIVPAFGAGVPTLQFRWAVFTLRFYRREREGERRGLVARTFIGVGKMCAAMPLSQASTRSP